MLSSFLYLLAIIVGLFWLIQLIDLFIRDRGDFESHTHKLVWFLVLVSGSIVGAIWYYFWKRHAIAAKAERIGR
jgi:H+/Cl- antiporter ClcA